MPLVDVIGIRAHTHDPQLHLTEKKDKRSARHIIKALRIFHDTKYMRKHHNPLFVYLKTEYYGTA